MSPVNIRADPPFSKGPGHGPVRVCPVTREGLQPSEVNWQKPEVTWPPSFQSLEHPALSPRSARRTSAPPSVSRLPFYSGSSALPSALTSDLPSPVEPSPTFLPLYTVWGTLVHAHAPRQTVSSVRAG